ncbi:hypothetical protein FDUTEX481_02019 [Tolypothrix sp. PCC 7601]|nr:hypothetical protein FDUTEX481_02019 [Tolypothrix sp. PCC 7601]BAY90808.1 hypothetical protein NIES3275_28250 [Microchaete diplosiphon NIES-3275]
MPMPLQSVAFFFQIGITQQPFAILLVTIVSSFVAQERRRELLHGSF